MPGSYPVHSSDELLDAPLLRAPRSEGEDNPVGLPVCPGKAMILTDSFQSGCGIIYPLEFPRVSGAPHTHQASCRAAGWIISEGFPSWLTFTGVALLWLPVLGGTLQGPIPTHRSTDPVQSFALQFLLPGCVS